jgi:hypothetical protein
MNRLGWLSLAVTGSALSLAGADDSLFPPKSAAPESLVVPVQQVEPGSPPTAKEPSPAPRKVSPPQEPLEDQRCEEYCSPTPFLDAISGCKDWLARRFELQTLGRWTGADFAPLGDVEDPYWIDVELKWGWFRPAKVPPMLTTSNPQSSLGIIGNEGTQVLFGGGDVNLQTHVGGKFTFGFWLEPSQAWGFEGSYFFFASRTSGIFVRSPNGDPLLASPFFNALNNENDSALIANQELTDPERSRLGGLADVYADSRLQGLELNAVNNALRGPNGRADWAWGYRYLRLDEGIHNNLISIRPPAQGQAFGPRFFYWDDFGTENSFHGFNIALRTQWWLGCWSWDVNGKLAVGLTRGTVDIFGRSITVSPPTGAVTVQPGGTYALSSNMGKSTDVRFSVIPEIETTIGYHFYDHLKLYLSYNFMIWNNVVRPGDQVDTRLNPNLFPPPAAGGPLQPERNVKTSTFWLQGLSLGLDFRY